MSGTKLDRGGSSNSIDTAPAPDSRSSRSSLDAALPQRSEPATRSPSSRAVALALLLVLALTGLRLLWLTADTPLDLPTASAAVFVDEGYKTLGPRNLVLFGETSWHPLDRYTGWMTNSPLTQWFHVLAFRLGSPDLAHGRALALFGTLLLLGSYAFGLSRRYDPRAYLGGLLLLGVSYPLFFYTRIALFEGTIAAVVVGALVALARWRTATTLQALLVVLLCAGIATFGIKRSALAYFVPMILALVVEQALDTPGIRSLRNLRVALIGIVGLALAFAFTAPIWSGRLDDSPLGMLETALIGPLSIAAPALTMAGILCALHILLTEGVAARRDRYRWALVWTVLLAPVAFAPFVYTPLRYFVPFLPAYLLLCLDWLAAGDWKRPLPPIRGWRAFATVALLSFFAMTLLSAINRVLLSRLALPLGDQPGIGARGLLAIGVPASLIAAVAVLRLASRSRPGVWLTTVGVLVVLHALMSLQKAAAFWISPSFRGVEIARQIDELLPEGATIAGDWAPFFALGSDLRALYVAYHNPPESITALRPQYFVFSDTTAGRETLEVLRGDPGIELGAPILDTELADREVRVYPIRYRNQE